MAKQMYLIIIAVMATLFCLAIEPSNAKPKKGCEAFGHACYGGHGKRSVTSAGGVEDIQFHSDAYSQMYGNDGRALEQYRRNRMINFLKQLVEGKRLYAAAADRISNNDVEYQTSGEVFKENNILN